MPAVLRIPDRLKAIGFNDLADVVRLILLTNWIITLTTIGFLLVYIIFYKTSVLLLDCKIYSKSISSISRNQSYEQGIKLLIFVCQLPVLLKFWIGGLPSSSRELFPFKPQENLGHIYFIGLALSIAVFGIGLLCWLKDVRTIRLHNFPKKS